MAQSEYPYPPDEFDREASNRAHGGVHRAEEPFWRRNALYVALIGLAVFLLLVMLIVVSAMGGSGPTPQPAPSGAPAASASTGAAAGSKPAQSAAPAKTQPEANRNTPVLVLNASGRNGLAASWKKSLKDKGWTRIDISTAKTRQEQPVIFYRDPADAATAQLLAKETGVGQAQQSDEYPSRITYIAVKMAGE